jgi:hypothetical protein
VELYETDIDNAYDHVEHGNRLAHLVQSLPRDTLLEFWLVTGGPVPLEHSIMLQMSQRRLKNITLHRQPGNQVVRSWLRPEYSDNIESVALIIDTFVDAQRGQAILTHAPRLRFLVLQQGTHPLARQSLDVLLEPWQNQTPQNTRLQLRSLILRSVDCTKLAKGLHTAIDLDKLQSLSIFDCHNSRELLLWLRQRSGKQLKHFKLCVLECPVTEFRSFFNSFTGLKSLHMSSCTVYRSACVDYFDAIGKHGSTLRELCLFDANIGEPGWSCRGARTNLTLLNDLFSKCPNLEELSIQAPRLPLDTDGQHADIFPAFLECLKKLTKLTALRLSVGSSLLDVNDSNFIRNSVHRDAILRRRTRDAVDRIFTAFQDTGCRLKGVAITVQEADIGSPAYAFLRQRALDPWNNEKVQACPVQIARLKCEMPNTSIFDHLA